MSDDEAQQSLLGTSTSGKGSPLDVPLLGEQEHGEETQVLTNDVNEIRKQRRLSGYDSEQSESDGSVKSLQSPKNTRKFYHSDSAISEGEMAYRKKLMKRLPMIPSKARYPSMPSKKPSNKFPRNIPRRVKGKYRKIVAEAETPACRIAVYCPSNELDLDAVYAHMVRMRNRAGTSDILPADEFSIESNRSMLPTLLAETRRHASSTIEGSPTRQLFNLDTVENPSWTASVFFDVLHLRQRKVPDIMLVNSRRASIGPTYGSMGSTAFAQADEDEMNDNEDSFRDCFLFGFGGIVLWNWDSEESEGRFVQSLRKFSSGLFDMEAAESASDDLEYYHGEKSSVKHDTIELSSWDPVERLAHSFAIAQSSLLSVYEFRLDEIIARNEHIPEMLVRHGKISLSQEEISREIGRLFMERNMINLESDILTCPEIFWENDRWEPVYKRMCRYMEHDERHEILNKRLDCVRELLDVLATQVENQHASKLEWIIIWLILCEVLVQLIWGILVKDILGYFQHCNDSN